MKPELLSIGFEWSSVVKLLDFKIRDRREKEVKLHGKKYWCLLEDERFSDQYDLRLLEPYKWSKGNKKMYGWTDGVNVFDESSTPIHEDSNKVVMFKLI